MRLYEFPANLMDPRVRSPRLRTRLSPLLIRLFTIRSLLRMVRLCQYPLFLLLGYRFTLSLAPLDSRSHPRRLLSIGPRSRHFNNVLVFQPR